MKYDSPKEIASFLSERGLSLKKRFGQNFLISPGARERIISTLAPEPDETVWEIGGGIGAMSHMLVERVRRLVVFEIDHGLIRVLEESLGSRAGFELIRGDYLRVWEATREKLGAPDRIIGNLPYNVASQIIASLVEWRPPVGRAVFTVQREVARRMAAPPGTKDYSGFSMICRSVFSVELHGDIAAPSFFPVPEVVSTVVSLTPKSLGTDFDRELYALVVRDLFAARRKTIRNNLAAGVVSRRYDPTVIAEALSAAAIDPMDRGETLTVDQLRRFIAVLEVAGEATKGSRGT